MPLALRRTDLVFPAVYKDRVDFTVFEDGREIGRIYEWDRHVPPERRWYWSIFMIGASGSGIRTNGRAPTLEDATRQFEENWRRHLVWTKLEPPDPTPAIR